ncbi:MAG: hypothetical protein IPK08_19565 [Bacteroidetes bacterium]|nr:hypothetical protein [Bacteroidota bacterium]
MALIQNATLTADRFGNANSSYSFNGLNQYAVLPALNFTNEMTISVWVMFPQIDSSQQEIITKYDADIGSGNQTTMRSFKILKRKLPIWLTIRFSNYRQWCRKLAFKLYDRPCCKSVVSCNRHI